MPTNNFNSHQPFAIANPWRIDSRAPRLSFAGGEQGAWFDPSDLTTLFQDSAGTIPVTGPNQPVGLILDKSKNGVGSNGAFAKNLLRFTEQLDNAYWSKLAAGTGVIPVVTANHGFAPDGTLTADRVQLDSGAAGNSQVSSTGVPTTIGLAYTFSIYLRSLSGSPLVTLFNNSTTLNVTVTTEWQRFTFTATASTTNDTVRLNKRDVFSSTGTADFLAWGAQLEVGATATAYQPITSSWPATIAGNHATQATAASRPTYGIHPITGLRNIGTGSASTGDVTYWPVSTVRNGVTATKIANGIDTDGLPFVDLRFQGLATGTFHETAYSFIAPTAIQGQTYTCSIITRVIGGTTANTIGITARVQELTNLDVFVDNSPSDRVTASVDTISTSSNTVNNATSPKVRALIELGFTSGATIDVTYRVKGLQFELGPTRTAYQFNFNQFNVTEAGVASVSYLGFDGVDDSMATGNVNFSTTDAVTVFTGLRKLSDVARAIVVELGTGGAGGFRIEAPPAIAAQYSFGSAGSLLSLAVSPSTFPAPLTSVLTGQGKISTDTTILRVNGTQVATSSSDQGTGNYANAQLFIGRRGGSSLPFNGNLYSLIVRGAESTAGQITSTEGWVNSKTGAY